MFTGLVEEVGAIVRKGGFELVIVARKIMEGMALGDSVAVDGACLTVAALGDGQFTVQVSPETFARTTLGTLRPGHAVNLERAMRADGRFGGHFVQGHVDGVGRVAEVKDQGEFSVWRFRAPEEVARYLVPKGSITIDGISLTVVEPENDTFSVAVIPATLTHTKLPSKRAGDAVNMEADLLGKHIYHYMRGRESRGITPDFLARHGFA